MVRFDVSVAGTSEERAVRSLTQLAPGELARIEEIVALEDQGLRLKSLGICVGRQVQLIQGGDPLIVRVLGTRVGVSTRLASEVRVSLL